LGETLVAQSTLVFSFVNYPPRGRSAQSAIYENIGSAFHYHIVELRPYSRSKKDRINPSRPSAPGVVHILRPMVTGRCSGLVWATNFFGKIFSRKTGRSRVNAVRTSANISPRLRIRDCSRPAASSVSALARSGTWRVAESELRNTSGLAGAPGAHSWIGRPGHKLSQAGPPT